MTKMLMYMVVMAVAFGLSGCVSQVDPRLQKAEEAAAAVESLKTELDKLDAQIVKLRTDLHLLRISANPYQKAVFDPSSPGDGSRIDSGQGMFLVSVRDVVPYMDGFRVTCNFGNPSSATYNGFKIRAKWGRRRDAEATGVSLVEWQASLREKELALPDSLRPGAWNPVTFVVGPAKADEFGYLELSIETHEVSLRR